jgi:hypothetical protein
MPGGGRNPLFFLARDAIEIRIPGQLFEEYPA